jgi:hypothetical protein
MINAQLGTELRRLREEAGYTAVEACEPLKAQGLKLSKIENGKQGATPEEAGILREFHGASNDERDCLAPGWTWRRVYYKQRIMPVP